MSSGQYLGRFAPSPTGELHFGSLVAAMASYCDAKHNQGKWFVRIDDIDPPREIPGAADAIIDALKALGFIWEDTLYQSSRSQAYRAALDTLLTANRLYCCSCSRRDLADFDRYPRLCLPANLSSAQQGVRTRLDQGEALTNVRLFIDVAVRFNDHFLGTLEVDFAQSPDDPVLYRKDGLVAYALACAIDDAQGITHVVRGSDLLGATGHQVAVMQALDMPTPQYTHIPLATDAHGQKLSKQTQAAAVDTQNALALLRQSWAFLGQDPFLFSTTGEFWNAAIPRWQLGNIGTANDA